MPDISMCTGSGCSKKKTCYRFTAKPSPYRQSYFGGSPVREDGECEYYWETDNE